METIYVEMHAYGGNGKTILFGISFFLNLVASAIYVF